MAAHPDSAPAVCTGFTQEPTKAVTVMVADWCRHTRAPHCTGPPAPAPFSFEASLPGGPAACAASDAGLRLRRGSISLGFTSKRQSSCWVYKPLPMDRGGNKLQGVTWPQEGAPAAAVSS